MPIVDDILLGLQIQIDSLWYNLLLSLASMHWSIQRAFLMMGYTIELMNQWLIDHAFTPLIAQTNASLQVAVTAAFAVALLTLGITYLLAAFARLRVVEIKSAIAWYLAGAVFFTLGPQLYQGMNVFRRELSQAFYTSSLSGLQAAAGSAFASLDTVASSDLALTNLCDNFGSYMPVWTPTVDGLDVALAYLRADGIDVMGYPSTPRDVTCQPHPADPVTGQWTAGAVPWEWRRPGSFFANDTDTVFFPAMTAEQRSASINMAASAHGRMLTGWSLILFGIIEQLVYLLLTVAQGLTFISFSAAILFAFFKKTEVIARSIVDLWIELIVQTVVIALIQSLVVTFFLAGTVSSNGVVVLGVGLISLVFMVIVLWSGVKAVWNSFNRLFNAFGQAAGGTVLSPGAASVMGVSGAAGVALAAATGGATLLAGAVGAGSNALAGMTALQQGATPAQAAGLTIGGVQAIASAARTLSYLPGLRGTALAEAAEQFTEGAVTRRVARDVPLVGRVTGPLIGGMLLSDRQMDHAEYDDQGRVMGRPMLIPAVGRGLERWTRTAHPSGSQPDTWVEDENGDLIPGFTALKPRRLGNFTPLQNTAPESTSSQTDRQTYADDMRGEELEQHLSETLTSVMTRNDHDIPLAGELRISGVDAVASLLGDVIQRAMVERGSEAKTGLDHPNAGQSMAREMGLIPSADNIYPIRENLARFGMFLDQALRSGLLPGQIESLVRDVKQSPDHRVSAEARHQLVNTVVLEGGQSPAQAETTLARLEGAAVLLPDQVVAIGTVTMPVASQD